MLLSGSRTSGRAVSWGLRTIEWTREWRSPQLSRVRNVFADTSELAPPGLHCCLIMRRTIALALMMMFSLTLIAPLFGPDADANLPPCCRRNGKHHCMMRMVQRLSDNQKAFTSVSEKCPCFPVSTCAVHSPTCKPEAGKQYYAEVVRHPSCGSQTKALCRISLLRSHQKRGPPAPLA